MKMYEFCDKMDEISISIKQWFLNLDILIAIPLIVACFFFILFYLSMLGNSADEIDDY